MEEVKIENSNLRGHEVRNKILLFVIGVLVGAVISTAAFFVYTKTLGTDDNSGSSMQMPGGGTPPEMPSGDSSESGQGQPPEKPGSNSSSSQSSDQSSGQSGSNSNSDSKSNSGNSESNS